MSAKLINDKDFFICKGGLMPAPLQSQQSLTTKKDGTRFIVVSDTSTQSFVDFACKKLMWLMALIAAIVAVLVVATGGAALIAIGAIAGAAGAVFGAVIGSLICGQKAAVARKWLMYKNDYKILGQNTITGDHKMLCSIFGEEISYVANIKNWWQAISLGTANFIGEVFKGAMIGASVGGGAAIIEGGMAALAEGGLGALGRSSLSLLKTLPGNLVKNFAASWFSGMGLGIRGVMGAQETLKTYGETGSAGAGDFAGGIVGMETGTAQSARNIFSGNGTAMDFIGLSLWFVPLPKPGETGANSKEAKPTEPTPAEENAGKADEAKTAEAPKTSETAPVEEKPAQDGEAYESSRLKPIKADPPFKPGEGHDVSEFERQIDGQQKGLNNLTVDEFLKNRGEYKENGRSSEGSKAQKRFREQAYKDKVKEYRDQGMSRKEAEAKAQDYMSDKAALHDPDQIAGGYGENVTGLGDANVNSSIGSQWKTRIESIEDQVNDQAKDMTPDELKNTKLNIHLYP